MEILHHLDQQFGVVFLVGHQMASAEVDPFQLREPCRELVFDMCQGVLELFGSALAMAMAMEALDVGRQLLRQLISGDTEARARCTRVIDQDFYL